MYKLRCCVFTIHLFVHSTIIPIPAKHFLPACHAIFTLHHVSSNERLTDGGTEGVSGVRLAEVRLDRRPIHGLRLLPGAAAACAWTAAPAPAKVARIRAPAVVRAGGPSLSLWHT